LDRLAFVTTNAGKFREARAILRQSGFELRWIRRVLPEIQAESLANVVLAKLDAVDDLGGTVLVEDSGLFVESLGGFPGVYSAPIHRMWGFDPILELLRRRPREAVFRTVAGIRRGRRRSLFHGQCRGVVVSRPRGTGGFGFDPIFQPDGFRKTFAEMTPQEKNDISHRAKALKAAARFLGRPR